MARERDFLDLERQDVGLPAGRRAAEGLPLGGRAAHRQGDQRPGRPLHGLRHPLLPRARPPAARSATSSPSGTSTSTTGAGKRRSTSCCRPTASPSSPGASAPPRARAPACWVSSGPPVNICKIELAIIEQGFQRGYVKAEPPARRRRQRVAVVGSGPAGLAAAHVLNRAGFNVTVYEKDARPGGHPALRHPRLQAGEVGGRPAHRPHEARGRGLRVRRRASAKTCRPASCATASTPSSWPEAPACRATSRCPGRDLAGIHFAMDFLTQQNRLARRRGHRPATQRITAEGKNVVVIGGGDTGSDCIGTSWRQGAQRRGAARDPARAARHPLRVHALAAVAAHEARLEQSQGGRHPTLERRHHGLPRQAGPSEAAPVRAGGVGARREPRAALPAAGRRAPASRSTPTWSCWPWASSPPAPPRWSKSSASPRTPAASSPATTIT